MVTPDLVASSLAHRTAEDIVAEARAEIMHALVKARLALNRDDQGRSEPLVISDRQYLEGVTARALASADPDVVIDLIADVAGDSVKGEWLPVDDRELMGFAKRVMHRYERELTAAGDLL